MSKNSQKKCHRNSNVSVTRLSNNSNNKKQMHHYSHDLAELSGSGSCPLRTVPSSLYIHAIYLISHREESSSDGRTHPFFSCCHSLFLTFLPTQSHASCPTAILLCFTGLFLLVGKELSVWLLVPKYNLEWFI